MKTKQNVWIAPSLRHYAWRVGFWVHLQIDRGRQNIALPADEAVCQVCRVLNGEIFAGTAAPQRSVKPAGGSFANSTAGALADQFQPLVMGDKYYSWSRRRIGPHRRRPTSRASRRP